MEVRQAVNEIKSCMAPGLDLFSVEYLKSRYGSVRMASYTGERMFWYGGCTYGLA